jgi:pimeloyl-ACP methyl ester carboxylesterase
MSMSSPFSVSPVRRALIAALLVAACAVSGAAGAAEFKSDRITVTTQGSGSDVVLVPGMASSPRVWTELMAAIPGHRYHLVKVNGFAGAPTAGNGSGLVVSAVAEEVARYMGESNLKKVPVIGHSMGGTVTLMVAARHPESVQKLMVVDMVPFLGQLFGPPGTTAQSIKPVADGILARMQAATPDARTKGNVAMIASMVKTEGKRAGALDDAQTSDPDVVARVYNELIVTDLGPELGGIKAPATILFVTPAGVPMTDAQMTKVYEDAYAPLKGAKVKHIANSAHFIMWDQPAAFQAEVKAFLN